MQPDAIRSESATAYAIPIGGGWSIICRACAEAHDADPGVVADEGTILGSAEPIFRAADDRCAVCES
jgi:hypothetical protein